MRRLIYHIIVGFLAFYLAVLFVPGVKVVGAFPGQLKIILFAGVALGIANFFLKPIIELITFPLRLLTLGFFNLVINMGMVFLIDVLFEKLIIDGIFPLFWTSLLVGFLSFLVPKKS